ncbi:transporter substrate-binding domain-containing protein [Aeromonas bestiarum]|uniref:transporter substrate-binding domain-containing protein n=1 Tax=Aeromonas bestiarum TaxID=105751 RepID=UPI0023EA52FB|nr:transporter substrate-binding domain-containing protein [Aeromonas bestiarum]
MTEAGLQVRKYDAIMSSMNITDERRQKVDFSQVYYMMQNRFVGRSDKAATFADDQAHFKGKVIAVQEGTPQDNFITASYGEVAKIKRYVNAQSPMLDLQSSRTATPSATWCS